MSGYYGNVDYVMSWCLQQVKKERFSSKQTPVKLIWHQYERKGVFWKCPVKSLSKVY